MNKSVNLNGAKTRNMGIECLRMLSMLMVVTLHVLGHGGILKNSDMLSANFNAAWFLEIACYGAVDLYALITGYVCIKSKHRWSRIIELWLQVVLYSAAFASIFYFLPGYEVSKKNLVHAFFPIMGKQYWYFSSYFCLFLVIPFINKAINGLSKLQHRKLIFTGVFAFCFMSLFSKFLGGDIFNVNNGYSFLWLSFLYIIGAYLKCYPEDTERYSKKICLLGYFICICCVWLSKLLINKIMGETKYSGLFISYISPFIVLGSICLFMFFLQLKVNHGRGFIVQAAPLAFSVYLISENVYVRNAFITNKFIKFTYVPWYLMLIYVLLSSLSIYIVCSLIDYLRKLLFSLLHIRSLSEKTVNFIKNKFQMK